MWEEQVDVVVVGAGFAGLSAARDLTRAGTSVLVVEANDRVGGRTLSEDVSGGNIVEHGGQWIGPGQDRIAALAKEVGVETFPTFGAGLEDLAFTGGIRASAGGGPGGAEVVAAIVAIEQLVAEIPLDAPWEAPDAAALDAKTVESWLRENVRAEEARATIRLLVEAVFSCQAEDLSMLHFLFYGRSGGSLTRLFLTEGGAQQDRLDGGTHLVARRVAAQLGDRVRLSSPVRTIRQTSDGVNVEGDDFRVGGQRVIVAVPPPMAVRISYEPPMPPLRDQLTQRLAMGSVIKAHAIYETPFWRDAGLSGRVVSDTGPLKIVFDNTPLSGSPGMLLGFFEGTEARIYGARPLEERREAALACLTRYFGSAAAHPIDYIDHDWGAEPFIRGAYAAILPTGAWTNFGRALREPVGRVHWAGTETSTISFGYIDGAVRSGERAAAEVLALI